MPIVRVVPFALINICSTEQFSIHFLFFASILPFLSDVAILWDFQNSYVLNWILICFLSSYLPTCLPTTIEFKLSKILKNHQKQEKWGVNFVFNSFDYHLNWFWIYKSAILATKCSTGRICHFLAPSNRSGDEHCGNGSGVRNITFATSLIESTAVSRRLFCCSSWHWFQRICKFKTNLYFSFCFIYSHF